MSSIPGSSKPENVKQGSVSKSSIKKKGILKKNQTPESRQRIKQTKSAKFDERNIQQTLHPANKTYGFMKIEEPKTPYRRSSDDDTDAEMLDIALLKDKLLKDMNFSLTDRFENSDSYSSLDSNRSDDGKFSKHRKTHYNMKEQLKLGRALIDKELEDDSDSD